MRLAYNQEEYRTLQRIDAAIRSAANDKADILAVAYVARDGLASSDRLRRRFIDDYLELCGVEGDISFLEVPNMRQQLLDHLHDLQYRIRTALAEYSHGGKKGDKDKKRDKKGGDEKRDKKRG